MNKTPRQPVEIRAELATAKARLAEIDRREKAIRAELAALQVERDTLYTPWGKGGRLAALTAELAVAELAEADAALPRLRVSANGVANTGEVVVSRVTRKRIYTRRPGETHEAIWTHEGMPEAQWSSARLLDLDKIADQIAKAGGAK